MSVSAVDLMMFFPPARTVEEPPAVLAEPCLEQPDDGKQGCGVTDTPGTTTARPLTRTVDSPLVATPPAVFASPCRCADGMLSH